MAKKRTKKKGRNGDGAFRLRGNGFEYRFYYKDEYGENKRKLLLNGLIMVKEPNQCQPNV